MIDNEEFERWARGEGEIPAQIEAELEHTMWAFAGMLAWRDAWPALGDAQREVYRALDESDAPTAARASQHLSLLVQLCLIAREQARRAEHASRGGTSRKQKYDDRNAKLKQLAAAVWEANPNLTAVATARAVQQRAPSASRLTVDTLRKIIAPSRPSGRP
jgi:hypothetical protein